MKKIVSILLLMGMLASLSPVAMALSLKTFCGFEEVIGTDNLDEITSGVWVKYGECADIDKEDLMKWLGVYRAYPNYDLIVAPLSAFEIYDNYFKLYNSDKSKSYTVYANGGVIIGKYGEAYESHGEIKQNYLWYLPSMSNSRSVLYNASTEIERMYFYESSENFKERRREPTKEDLPVIPEDNLLDTSSASDWAKPEIEKASACNFMLYDLENKYKNPITRLDFSRLAYKMIAVEFNPNIDSRVGAQEVMNNVMLERGIQRKSNMYTDCGWHEVEILSSMGIIYGMGDGTFNPDGEITREQAAAILYRIAEFLGTKTMPQEGQKFSDEKDIAPWALKEVKTIHKMGVMQGVEKGIFSPKGAYTVEQAIATMLRLYECY